MTSNLFDGPDNDLTFDPDELAEIARVEALRIGHMLFLGHGCLEFMKCQGIDLVYPTWKGHVQHAAPDFELVATDDEWLWAWESLRQSSPVTKRFGKLRAAGVRWKSNRERFDCLPARAEFAVAVKQAELETRRASVSDRDFNPTVHVTTIVPLQMKPGKANRLECCDTACVVTITVESVHNAEKEADLMRVEPSEIEIVDKSTVQVKAKSLNQAYTNASRRLEPNRRGHGGRTYDRFVYVDREAGKTFLLDEVRAKVEEGTWKVPNATELNAGNHQAESERDEEIN